MADRVLRDHNGKCVDGFTFAHHIGEGKWCPGGQEVTDSDILTMAADIIETNPSVGAIIDAGLPDDG